MKTLQQNVLFLFLITTNYPAAAMYNNTMVSYSTTEQISVSQLITTQRLLLSNSPHFSNYSAPHNYARQHKSKSANNKVDRVDSLSVAINNHLSKTGKQYCPYPIINFCARLCSLPYYTINNPQEELLSLAPLLDNELTSVAMVKQLQQKNTFFRDCLQLLRVAGASLHKNISPIAIDTLPVPIKQYLTQESNQFCKNNLGIHPLVLKKIISNTIKLTLFYTLPADTDGLLSNETLRLFLAQTFKEGKLSDAAFNPQHNVIKTYDLGNQGGYNNRQLYLVISANNKNKLKKEYLIKESLAGIDEIIGLKKVASAPILQKIIFPRIMPGLPSFLLPIEYCAYSTNDSIHYLTIMPKAPGIGLNVIIDNFNENQTVENRNMLASAFYALGVETANAHQLLIIHGDYHFFHLFYDNGHFTVIDNQSMSFFINKKEDPAIDIVKLFMMPFSAGSYFQQFKDLIRNIDLKTWHDLTLKNFVLGYASTYHPRLKNKIIIEIRNMFNRPFEIPWVYFHQHQIEKLRNKYINPLFDELFNQEIQHS